MDNHQTKKRKHSPTDTEENKSKHIKTLSLIEMPYNVVTFILEYLKYVDLWRIGEVSKDLLYQLRDNAHLWKSITVHHCSAVKKLARTKYPYNKIKSLSVDTGDEISTLDLSAFTGLELITIDILHGSYKAEFSLIINSPSLKSLEVYCSGIWNIKSEIKLTQLKTLKIGTEVTISSLTSFLNKVSGTSLTTVDLSPNYDESEEADNPASYGALIRPEFLQELRKFENLTHFSAKSDALTLFALRHLPRDNLEFVSVTSNKRYATLDLLPEAATKQIVFPKLKQFELYNYSIVAFEVRDLINYWAPNLEIFKGEWGGFRKNPDDFPISFYASAAGHPIFKNGYIYRDRCSILATKFPMEELIKMDGKWVSLFFFSVAQEKVMVANGRIDGPVVGVRLSNMKDKVESTYEVPLHEFLNFETNTTV